MSPGRRREAELARIGLATIRGVGLVAAAPWR